MGGPPSEDARLYSELDVPRSAGTGKGHARRRKWRDGTRYDVRNARPRSRRAPGPSPQGEVMVCLVPRSLYDRRHLREKTATAGPARSSRQGSARGEVTASSSTLAVATLHRVFVDVSGNRLALGVADLHRARIVHAAPDPCVVPVRARLGNAGVRAARLS